MNKKTRSNYSYEFCLDVHSAPSALKPHNFSSVQELYIAQLLSARRADKQMAFSQRLICVWAYVCSYSGHFIPPFSPFQAFCVAKISILMITSKLLEKKLVKKW